MKREMLLLDNYYQQPSPQALEEVVEAYLPLAKRIARRFVGRGVELEDLEQVASLGLLKSIERFEPERGLQFSSYATPTIVGDLRNYIRDKGNIVRLPREAKNKLYHLEKQRDLFYQQYLREPTFAELAKEMNMTIDEILQLLEFREKGEVYSIDGTIGDQEETSLELFLGEEDMGYGQVEKSDWLSWVYSLVNPKEKLLLQLRYEQGLGQRDTAKQLGVSQMQVSRLERKLLEKLRAIEIKTNE